MILNQVPTLKFPVIKQHFVLRKWHKTINYFNLLILECFLNCKKLQIFLIILEFFIRGRNLLKKIRILKLKLVYFVYFESFNLLHSHYSKNLSYMDRLEIINVRWIFSIPECNFKSWSLQSLIKTRNNMKIFYDLLIRTSVYNIWYRIWIIRE